jgi:hypothetical protein
METTTHTKKHSEPWNKGKLIGQKPPLKLKEIWALRVRIPQFAHEAAVPTSDSPDAIGFHRRYARMLLSVPVITAEAGICHTSQMAQA